ncbi:MAG TPA: non-ribosomal peptide synthetase, partial [Terrimicrobiaceae bacterium]
EELAASATKIARLLKARELQPGEVVVVNGQCSFGLISGMMGVLLARGVLLMLDSSLPSARRDLMVGATSAKHWLQIGETKRLVGQSSEVFRSLRLTQISPEGNFVEAQSEMPSESSSFDPPRPEDPAYVFFTSGTTGAPKAILGTHKGLSHFLQWERKAIRITAEDRVAQLTGLSFDVVLRDIFLPLTAGATLCLPDTGSAPHESSVVLWLSRERITILHTVPSLASAWLDGIGSSARLPDLRWVLFAGEPLTAALVQQWREKIGTTGEIFNLYGPTETTLAKCAYRVPQDPEPGVQPIGSPLPNTQVLVINKADQLCGIGEPGEIVIRTPFRTLGYLNLSPEGPSGYISNPFGDDLKDIVYRTGDCGTYDFQGQLRIAGRFDDQIKIRGSRVEPAEVAAALAQYPDVQQSAVVVQENQFGEKCLVAYLVQKPSREPLDITHLRDFLKRSLPEYMVPVAYVALDKLPLTPNGKLDRKTLPSVEAMRLQKAPRSVPARNSTELALASLWSKLLKVDEIGIHEDFFELGGHSLTATRLVSQIQKE